MTADTRPPEAWLYFVLAFVGSYGDAASVVLAKTFTGHVTGSLVLAAIAIAAHKWSALVAHLSAVLFFLVGIISSVLIERALAAWPLFKSLPTVEIVIGAISSNAVLVKDGISETGFLRTWFHPFPLIVGGLSLSLFAYLSACYLIAETNDTALQNDFRKRALISGLVSIVFALLTYFIAGDSAKPIRDGLSRAPYVRVIELGAAIAASVAFQALWSRSYLRARMAAAAQVALITIGWGAAQYPYLIRPELTIVNSAAPSNILLDLELAVAVGAVVLIPSLILLLVVFKTHREAISAGADTTSA